MPSRNHRSPPKPIPIGRKEYGLSKVGAARFDPRDPYHLAVSLRWPPFALLMLTVWLGINLLFALLYRQAPGAIANAAPGSFSDVFFFSIETLATVGYGVMAPASLYGHIVSAAEIVTGMTFTAIVTGLLFVRFSRPKAKIAYAADAVVSHQNGHPTLMLRLINARVTIMSSASVRLFVRLDQHAQDGTFHRSIHELPLRLSHQPIFIMPWTIAHAIDRSSPLHGHDQASLAAADAMLFLTIEARDHALAALVQDIKDYPADRIRFGMRFADMVRRDEQGRATADITQISLLEPDPDVWSSPATPATTRIATATDQGETPSP
jgi:inward rectifier potassium channel